MMEFSLKRMKNPQQERRKTDRHRIRIPMTRVEGELSVYDSFEKLAQPTERMIVRVLLSDVTPSGVGVFAQSPVFPGSTISLTIPMKQPFYARARVTWCREVLERNSSIVSENNFRFRLGLQFVFESEQDRKAALDFYNHLKTTDAVTLSSSLIHLSAS